MRPCKNPNNFNGCGPEGFTGRMRLSKGISDEIEDATISIDETKISEIEATKRRFRNYCVQTKY